MINYWRNLQDRERLTLVGGALAVTLLLLWALVWEPIDTARARLSQSVSDQTELLSWMQGAAAEVAQRKGSAAGAAKSSGQSLLSRVESTARRSGLAKQVKRIQPDSNGVVQVWLEAAPFDEALVWIAKIIEEEKLIAQDLSIDRAEGAGLVNIRLVVKDKTP